MLSFHAYESSWLCARGSGCHEQYFGSACHWEHFHMLIRINNSCSVICLMFFPSLFFSRGQNGWEMMLPWREGQAICILSPWRAWWAWVSTAEDVEDDWGRLGSNASLSFREPFMLCAGSWAAAGSWSVCTGNTLCCSAFLLHLTSQRLFEIRCPVIFWTLLSLNKTFLGNRPSRAQGFSYLG